MQCIPAFGFSSQSDDPLLERSLLNSLLGRFCRSASRSAFLRSASHRKAMIRFLSVLRSFRFSRDLCWTSFA
jgi:hypothetical protein